MVDRERALALIDIVDQRASDIEAWTPNELDEYLGDALPRHAIERALQVGIEALVDVGSLLVRDLRLGLPGDEAGIVKRLREAKLLSKDEADLLSAMRGFRNVLVHRYGDIDDAKVFDNAKRAPDDLRRLANAFRRVLRDHEGGRP